MTRSLLGVLTAVAIAGLSGAALAGSTYDTTGTSKGKSTSTIHPIAEGHVLMNYRGNNEMFAFNDAEHPLNGGSGPCFGGIEIRGTAAAGSGYCNFTDRDKDAFVISWTVTGLGADGALQGNWTLIGGNGKYAGGAGGGAFTNHLDMKTGRYDMDISGATTLK